MGCPVCEGRLDGGRKASRDARKGWQRFYDFGDRNLFWWQGCHLIEKSEIEKNLKFTIEQNIVEINRLKALLDEANNKQKQEQFAHAVLDFIPNIYIYVRLDGFIGCTTLDWNFVSYDWSNHMGWSVAVWCGTACN